MASKRKPAVSAPEQGALSLEVVVSPTLAIDISHIEALAAQLAAAVAELPLAAKVEALNRARAALHEISPFKAEPVDLVTWLRAEDVHGYEEYPNPNTVAPPERALLTHSIEKNGVGVALVTHKTDTGDVVVDGMHRREVETTHPVIRARLHGYVPVSRIRADRSDVPARIAATVEFNRARGEHGVDAMSGLVRALTVSGWTEEQIQAELGMQADEVLRLKQITGLAALFADREFSEGWEASS